MPRAFNLPKPRIYSGLSVNLKAIFPFNKLPDLDGLTLRELPSPTDIRLKAVCLWNALKTYDLIQSVPSPELINMAAAFKIPLDP